MMWQHILQCGKEGFFVNHSELVKVKAKLCCRACGCQNRQQIIAQQLFTSAVKITTLLWNPA